MRAVRVGVGVAIALALSVAGSPAAETLTIGVGAPLSGPDARYGSQVRLGVEQAIVDINADGGFLGRQAKVDARDDGADVKKGVEVAKAFVAAKVPIVVGHFSSAVTVAASVVYADAGMLDITPAAIAPLVTDRGLVTVFRTCGRSDGQAEVAARFLLARQARVAILHDKTDVGKGLADAVRAALVGGGGQDVFYGSLEKGSRDASALVGRLKAAGVQIAFWGGGGAEAGVLARQIHDANAHVVLMGGMAMASDDFPATAGAAADGTLMVFPQDPRTRPAAADLLQRFRDAGQEPDAYVFYSYAAVQVVRQAAEAAHSLEPKKLAETMHSGMTFKTVLGDVTFDAKGDPKPSDLAVYVWHKGANGRMTFDDLAKS